MGERILYPVRHGQMDVRAFAEDQFHAGITAMGREQARVTAKRLKGLRVRAIYCSMLGRARQTAEIIATEFPKLVLQPSPLLWELPNLGPADDESWRSVFAKGKQRGERAFLKFVRPTRERQRIEILVSHGNLIRYLVCRVLGIEPEAWWSLAATSHCGITQLQVAADNKARVICYNETGHLSGRLLGK